MVITKSSGIIVMNYKYKIKNNSVTEFENNHYNGNWSFEFLKKNTAPSLSEFMGVADSFYRAKEWVSHNHPEFLL
jgi:hypothetical protein